MLTERVKLIVSSCLISCVLFGIVLGVLGCLGMMVMTPQSGSDFQHSRRNVDIAINIGQREEFFNQLRKFAIKHDFTIRIDTRTSGSENFLVYMTRDGIEIIGDNAFVPGEYGFGFYDVYNQPQVAESVLDDLISDLQIFVSEVPSATFSVEEK